MQHPVYDPVLKKLCPLSATKPRASDGEPTHYLVELTNHELKGTIMMILNIYLCHSLLFSLRQLRQRHRVRLRHGPVLHEPLRQGLQRRSGRQINLIPQINERTVSLNPV